MSSKEYPSFLALSSLLSIPGFGYLSRSNLGIYTYPNDRNNNIVLVSRYCFDIYFIYYIYIYI